MPTFNVAGVTLYQVSIAQVLGDSGTAIDHAERLRPAEMAQATARYKLDLPVSEALS